MRETSEVIGTPRAIGRSLNRTKKEEFERAAPPEVPLTKKVSDFFKIRVWEWITTYIGTRLGKKHELPPYPSDEDNGIYPLAPIGRQPSGSERITVCLAADWGTGTLEARDIATAIGRVEPDFTIHLGDVYYVGSPKEVERAFFREVQWPRGSAGSFALNGNHEMYANGNGYFDHLIPKLGLSAGPDGQRTSYFALENDHWRVIGLDTGYHSVGIPFLEKIKFFKPSSKLPDPLLEWLRTVVQLGDPEDRRGIILLSHHQYYSAFEGDVERAGEQLAELLGRERAVLWFWGHEHRLAVYGASQTKKGVRAFGRCIGHGGMPVELGSTPKEKKAERYRLAFYDDELQREEVVDVGQGGRVVKRRVPIGHNGFAELTFEGPRLKVAYRRARGQPLLTETWEVTPEGELRGVSVERHSETLTQYAAEPETAIT